MQLVKRKKGFTLIELMAVIAIIAILAVVLVPTVNGYINRSKKTAVITQTRTIVNGVEAYNATAAVADQIADTAQLSDIKTKLATSELIAADENLTALPDDIKYSTLKEINSDQAALDKITISNGELTTWTGSMPYPGQ